MKLMFEEEGKKLFFSLNSDEKLVVELEEDDLKLELQLNEAAMAKLINGLKLIIYESEL
jgi:hypothetical protein